MPDKIQKKGCGKSCMRCWLNKMKHANPEVKKYAKKNDIFLFTKAKNIKSLEADYIKKRDEKEVSNL